jgi:hypothetical protein
MNRYLENEEYRKRVLEYIESQSNDALYCYYVDVDESSEYNKEEKDWIMGLISKKMLK